MKYIIIPILIFLSCSTTENETHIIKSSDEIIIDGKATETTWSKAHWRPLDQRWLGEKFTSEDFSGRYKLAWNQNYLYILAEIIDDKLIDIHNDGLEKYWDDDCLEIFVDEDNSKGWHLYSHNAFAYHISLSGQVVDIGPDSLPHYYNDHVINKKITSGTTSTWECAVRLFNDSYEDGKNAKPTSLTAGKKIGFALAYCDNDNSPERENFIGSVYVDGEDKNQGYITADIFREMILR